MAPLALSWLRLCPEQKTITNFSALFPSQKAVSPLRGLQPRWPLVLGSLPLPHAFFKSMYTWKSSKYYIIISMMTPFMRVSQKLVFHDSKCICASNRILSTTAMYVSWSSFMYLRIPCYWDACLNSSLLRVGVKMLLNTIVMILLVVAELCEQAITNCWRISIFLEGFLNTFRLLLVVDFIKCQAFCYMVML